MTFRKTVGSVYGVNRSSNNICHVDYDCYESTETDWFIDTLYNIYSLVTVSEEQLITNNVNVLYNNVICILYIGIRSRFRWSVTYLNKYILYIINLFIFIWSRSLDDYYLFSVTIIIYNNKIHNNTTLLS